jgi:hypothetical protein
MHTLITADDNSWIYDPEAKPLDQVFVGYRVGEMAGKPGEPDADGKAEPGPSTWWVFGLLADGRAVGLVPTETRRRAEKARDEIHAQILAAINGEDGE